MMYERLDNDINATKSEVEKVAHVFLDLFCTGTVRVQPLEKQHVNIAFAPETGDVLRSGLNSRCVSNTDGPFVLS